MGGWRWASSPFGGWKATTKTEVGCLEVVLKALWGVGSNRLESDGGARGGSQGKALWRVGDNHKTDMGGLEVTIRVLWRVKDFAIVSSYTWLTFRFLATYTCHRSRVRAYLKKAHCRDARSATRAHVRGLVDRTNA